MSYLEEVLPEFRKGAKIRLKDWGKDSFIYIKKNAVYNEDDKPLDGFEVDSYDVFSDDGWEFYKEPEPAWDYIIKNKCLCWFWDDADNLEESSYGYLIRRNEHTKCFCDGKKWYYHCQPVCKDELNLYEERNDE